MTRKSPIQSMFVAGLMALTLSILSSCSQGGSVQPGDANRQNTVPDNFQHIVQSGETLGMIADWYTGKASNWTLIVDSNPGLRPERLRPGQIVLIPRKILIKDTPIPKGYSQKRKGTPVTAGNATGVDAEKVDPSGGLDAGMVESGPAGESGSAGGTDSAVTETGTKSGGEAVDDSDFGSKIDSNVDDSKSQAEAAAKAAEEAALADKNAAESAAEKAKADAEAAAKAASEAAADAAAAAKNGPKANPDDAEREKLLDELLAQ